MGGQEFLDFQVVVFGLVHEWDEAVEPPRLILEVADPHHMIDPVAPLFDMAKKHRHVGFHPPLVPFAVDFQPLLRIDFPFADKIAHPFVENLGTSAGHRINTVCDHQIKDLVVTFAVFLGEEVDLRGGECLDMQLRMALLDFSENLQIPLQPRIGVMRGDDMHLFDPARGDIVRDGKNLLVAHRVGVGIFTAGTVSTEFADIFADIGRIDMTVDVEIGLFSVEFETPFVSKFPEGEKIKVVQRHRLIKGEPFAPFYFCYQIHEYSLSLIFQRIIAKEKRRVGATPPCFSLTRSETRGGSRFRIGGRSPVWQDGRLAHPPCGPISLCCIGQARPR